jgi:hypothetical protein
MTFGSADGGIVSELQSRHGHSAQPESQQVLAVLQAVLEVISAQGMSTTPTTMFAALMSALERPDAQESPVVRPTLSGSQQQQQQQMQQQQHAPHMCNPNSKQRAA